MDTNILHKVQNLRDLSHKVGILADKCGEGPALGMFKAAFGFGGDAKGKDEL